MPPLSRGPPVAQAPHRCTHAVPGIPTPNIRFTPVSAKPYHSPLRPPTLQMRTSQVTKLSIIVAGAPLQVSAGPPLEPPLPALPLAPALPALPALPPLPALPASPAFPAFPALPASPALPAFPASPAAPPLPLA